MPLTAEGAELLKLAKINILANPDFYDQHDIAQETPCGTVCCVAGWIDYLRFGPKEHLKRVKENEWVMWRESAEALGLDDEESAGVFEEEIYHPDPQFREEYREATTPTQRAKAAAGMIDRFIANHTAQ